MRHADRTGQRIRTHRRPLARAIMLAALAALCVCLVARDGAMADDRSAVPLANDSLAADRARALADRFARDGTPTGDEPGAKPFVIEGDEGELAGRAEAGDGAEETSQPGDLRSEAHKADLDRILGKLSSRGGEVEAAKARDEADDSARRADDVKQSAAKVAPAKELGDDERQAPPRHVLSPPALEPDDRSPKVASPRVEEPRGIARGDDGDERETSRARARQLVEDAAPHDAAPGRRDHDGGIADGRAAERYLFGARRNGTEGRHSDRDGAEKDDRGRRWNAYPKAPETRETRVTVLLELSPRTRFAERRFERRADPVICIARRCYVSRGADDDAREMTRIQALGPANSLGGRAGACRRAARCVFRNVDLEAVQAGLQPVDLNWLRHDRRETIVVEADQSCSAADGGLTCRNVVRSATFRMWIVPEHVAEAAGSSALEDVLERGLGRAQHARY